MQIRPRPHNQDDEMATLGSMLLSPAAADLVRAQLAPGDFYVAKHREIAEALWAVERADLVTVTGWLAERGKLDDAGGPSYVSGLLTVVPTAANVEQYATRVADASRRRQLIDSMHRGIASATDFDRDDPVADVIDELVRIGKQPKEQSVEPVVWIEEALNRVMNADAGAGPRGIPTGVPELDDSIDGWHAGDLIVLAARTSHGKSTFVYNAMLEAASRGKRVLLFSLESSPTQVGLRLMSLHTSINGQNLRKGWLTPDQRARVFRGAGALSAMPLYVDFRADVGPAYIRARARRVAALHGVDMIAVDFLQMMRPPDLRANRVQQLGDMTRAMKAIAGDLGVPLILVSQLSRAAEHEQPSLRHLRESGQIEEAADVIILLHRERSNDARLLTIDVAKQRVGPIGSFQVSFDPATGKLGTHLSVV